MHLRHYDLLVQAAQTPIPVATRASQSMLAQLIRMTTSSKGTKNNFDLIRLIAALQVVVVHAVRHVNPQPPVFFALITALLSYLPGVPVFFFVSGYLIYGSFENIEHKSAGRRLTIFFTNRVLRLYPALIVCFCFTLASIYFSGYLRIVRFSVFDLFRWIAASLTIVQFYNPDWLRAFGTGVTNGSLWTISVELQFYILTPFIYALLNNYKKQAAVFFLVLVVISELNASLNTLTTPLQKLAYVTALPWLYMFMLGAFLSTSKSIQDWILALNGWLLTGLYILIYYVSTKFNLGIGNNINAVALILLCAIIFKAAYTKPDLSSRVLGRNDISYGTYIYHMPIVNLLLYLGCGGQAWAVGATIVLSLIIAMTSWVLVERPALQLKKIALRRV